MMPTVTTFLMFDGKAEDAMNYYVSLFKNSAVTSIERYGADFLLRRLRIGKRSRSPLLETVGGVHSNFAAPRDRVAPAPER